MLLICDSFICVTAGFKSALTWGKPFLIGSKADAGIPPSWHIHDSLYDALGFYRGNQAISVNSRREHRTAYDRIYTRYDRRIEEI